MQPRHALAGAVVVLLSCCPVLGSAQSSREAQRKLDRIQHELKAVATQRREIADQRSDASRQLRTADEQLGHSGRALSETQTRLAREQAALAALQQRRQDLQEHLGAQRQELAGLLHDAYTVRPGTPLQLMLAQDRVADASRLLTLHGYLQRDRARRIGLLTTQLRELDTVEAQIGQTRAQLAATQAAQHAQLAQLQHDRAAQAKAVAQLEQRYRDRAEREQALTRDAHGLQQLLAQLRAAAAREAQRKAAAARAARAAREATSASGAHPTRRPPPPVIANAAPLRVGGLGWPVAGTLLAGFGATLPDGGTSHGVLIAAPTGTPVKAVADGRVVFADWMNGYGLIVIVDHGNGNMSLYAHNEALLRDVGATIKRGDALASVGNSGGGSQPGVYFELRRDGLPVNPMGWLQKN